GRKPIDVRRPDLLLTVAAEVTPAEVIRQNEDHVGRRIGRLYSSAEGGEQGDGDSQSRHRRTSPTEPANGRISPEGAAQLGSGRCCRCPQHKPGLSPACNGSGPTTATPSRTPRRATVSSAKHSAWVAGPTRPRSTSPPIARSPFGSTGSKSAPATIGRRSTASTSGRTSSTAKTSLPSR